MGIQVIKPPKQDTFINKRKSRSKNFHRRFLLIGSDCKNIFRTFIKFNLSSLPPFIDIINGTLNLYLVKNSVPSCYKTVTVHQILSRWNERTLSYRHQPLYSATPVSSVSLTNQNNSLVSFDLMPLMQMWYSGTEANLGVMLKMSDESMPKLVFLSKEYPNEKLVLSGGLENKKYFDNLQNRLDFTINHQQHNDDSLWDGMVYQKGYYARVMEYLYKMPFALEALTSPSEKVKTE